ncbi:orexigenic neuropeptide QRFP [Thomomys bottae]
MRGPGSLPYLLLLPLGACFPLLRGREPMDPTGAAGARMSWASLAEGPRLGFVHAASPWPPSLQPQASLVVTKASRASHRARTGFRLGRQDGVEAHGFPSEDGEQAGGRLGNLAQELSGYSRKKGGFSFRFGRG